MTFVGSTGWVVGDTGKHLRDDQRRDRWPPQTSGTTKNLRAVSFTSATSGWAVGDQGAVLQTSNGGSTWTVQTPPTTKNLNGVYALDATHVWVVGQNTGPGQPPYIGFYNGFSWTQQTAVGTQDLNFVDGTDASHVWAVGQNGTLLFFNGTSWSGQASGTTQPLNAVHALDSTHLWAVGNAGTILFSANGTTWSAQTSGTTAGLNDVSFGDATHGWAVGKTSGPGQPATILVWDGATWTVSGHRRHARTEGRGRVQRDHRPRRGDGRLVRDHIRRRYDVGQRRRRQLLRQPEHPRHRLGVADQGLRRLRQGRHLRQHGRRLHLDCADVADHQQPEVRRLLGRDHRVGRRGQGDDPADHRRLELDDRRQWSDEELRRCLGAGRHARLDRRRRDRWARVAGLHRLPQRHVARSADVEHDEEPERRRRGRRHACLRRGPSRHDQHVQRHHLVDPAGRHARTPGGGRTRRNPRLGGRERRHDPGDEQRHVVECADVRHDRPAERRRRRRRHARLGGG